MLFYPPTLFPFFHFITSFVAMNSSSVLRSSLERALCRIHSVRRPIHRRLSPYSKSAAAGGGGELGDGSDRAVTSLGLLFIAVAGVFVSGSAAVFFTISSKKLDQLGSRSGGSRPVVAGDDGEGDVADGNKTWYLFGDAYRKRVFFNYEKRMRLRSPPEKVFEYFASHHTPEGDIFMTPSDLMRAVVPVVPPSDSNLIREGYLRGERRHGDLYCPPSKYFLFFDTNNDGFISFPEYIFFVTLLSIPESSFSVAFKMFDHDNNGEIDRGEFKKVMALMRSYNRQGATYKFKGQCIGQNIGESMENWGVVEHFFGKDGTGSLQYERFVEFLRDLHNEIVFLEFSHYDFKSKGTISAQDFAHSMVASADIKHINKFFDRVDKLKSDLHLRDMRFTFEEFKAFAELRRRLGPLAFAIFSYGKINGLLSKSDFQRASSHVCGITLSDNMVDIIFHIFDTNRDGSLSCEEFLNALQRRETDIREPTSSGIMGGLFHFGSVSRTKSYEYSYH